MAKIKQVYLGFGPRNMYIIGGVHYGPGTVELPYETEADIATYNDLVACVKRAQINRPPDEVVKTEQIGMPESIASYSPSETELLDALAAMRAGRINDEKKEMDDAMQIALAADAANGIHYTADASPITAEMLRASSGSGLPPLKVNK